MVCKLPRRESHRTCSFQGEPICPASSCVVNREVSVNAIKRKIDFLAKEKVFLSAPTGALFVIMHHNIDPHRVTTVTQDHYNSINATENSFSKCTNKPEVCAPMSLNVLVLLQPTHLSLTISLVSNSALPSKSSLPTSSSNTWE